VSTRLRKIALRTVLTVGIVNFAAFFIAALYLGGDAINGKAQNGRYYLGSHGRYTEVSEAVFNFSRQHALSLIITHPAAMLAGFVLVRDKKAAQLKQAASQNNE
jgi:hypothetical protein